MGLGYFSESTFLLTININNIEVKNIYIGYYMVAPVSKPEVNERGSFLVWRTQSFFFARDCGQSH